MKLAYRPDIDGLRAIAVLLVIAFHAGSSTLSGGFIGVDVFFVISGFLITSIICQEIHSDSFRFSVFYRKRMKRILPPFYLVTLCSLVAGFIIFTPQDLLDLGKHVRYAVSFVSNIFLLRNSGYFAPEADTLPLLHTWSLSIEEQFYLAWPAILILLRKKLQAASVFGLSCVMCLVSLAYSQYLVGTNQDDAYYQIQSRAWELLLGAALAIAVSQGLVKKLGFMSSKSLGSTMAVAGLALIIVPAITYTQSSPFPGIYAVLPCMGAALLILSGSTQDNLIKRALSLKPMIFIGLLSYSLYLWHWPIIAYARYLFTDFGLVHASLCVLAAFVLSVMSYYLVEKPLRFNSMVDFRQVLLFYLVIPITLFVIASKSINSHAGFPERLSQSVIDKTEAVFSEYKRPFPETIKRPEVFDHVIMGITPSTLSDLDAIVWGDSHAMHLYAWFDEVAKLQDLSLVASSDGACAPLIGAIQVKYGRKRNKGCEEKNQATLDYILASDIKLVILSARWALHYETTRYGSEGGIRRYLGDESDMTQSTANTRRVFEESLTHTVKTLQAYGKTVVLLQQVPSHKQNVANCVIKAEQYPNLSNGDCQIALEEVISRQTGYRQVFQALSKNQPELKIVSFDSSICTSGHCAAELDEVPLYKDNDHLNAVGARALAKEWLARGNRLPLGFE